MVFRPTFESTGLKKSSSVGLKQFLVVILRLTQQLLLEHFILPDFSVHVYALFHKF